MSWKNTIIASDESHHLLDGLPLYEKRFEWVQKFHEPGLAPVGDQTGAYHIKPDGSPAYSKRFIWVFGYYFNRAGVITEDGWTHIDPDGRFVYNERYVWVGNYQDEVCTIRDSAGNYFHINLYGERMYPENYLYAGDYRDGVAVVRLFKGLCTHINKKGHFVHNKFYIDLDVYHKGYARARDEMGWFHVNQFGNPIYKERFAIIEPFYNNFALVETLDGIKGIINESGHFVHKLQTK